MTDTPSLLLIDDDDALRATVAASSGPSPPIAAVKFWPAGPASCASTSRPVLTRSYRKGQCHNCLNARQGFVHWLDETQINVVVGKRKLMLTFEDSVKMARLKLTWRKPKLQNTYQYPRT